MASPVAHSLLGLAVGRTIGSASALPSKRWHVFSAVAANFADLDFLPGLIVGDINRFHQGISHSILAAVVFGGMVALLVRSFSSKAVSAGVVGAALYASHLLLDLLTEDKRAPFGTPLLWPFSSRHFVSPWELFGGVQHGVPGEGFSAFLGQLFSWHNVGVIGLETLVLVPILLLAWQLRGLALGKPLASLARRIQGAREPNEMKPPSGPDIGMTG